MSEPKALTSRIHQLARSLRAQQTPAEKLLWSQLRGGQIGGFKLRRQFPIGEFIADFCCPEKRLVIELDGSQHGEDAFQIELDRRRSALLAKRGFRVVRFWNEDIFSNIDNILEQLLAELES
jgi:very-short-patch-repair endonuclease